MIRGSVIATRLCIDSYSGKTLAQALLEFTGDVTSEFKVGARNTSVYVVLC
jgi:hypothetical protein